MRLPIVRARWKDAYSRDGEQEADKIAALAPFVEVLTVGYLVRKTREAVYVAQDWLPGDELTSACWRGITVIPRGMVIDVTVVRSGASPR